MTKGEGGAFQANIAAGVCVMTGFLWFIALLIPHSWHHGNLFYVLNFESGLFFVKVSKGIGGHVLGLIGGAMGGKLGKAAKGVLDSFADGSYGIMDMTSRMCVVPNEMCDAFQRLQFASLGQGIAGLIIMTSCFLGATFLGYFWHSVPSEAGRVGARMCLMISPILGFSSLALYWMLTNDFGPTDNSLNFGMAYFMALFATIWSCIPCFLFEVFVNEKAAIMIAARQNFKEELTYGATESGAHAAYGAYGAYPPPGQQYNMAPPYGVHPPQASGYYSSTQQWSTAQQGAASMPGPPPPRPGPPSY